MFTHNEKILMAAVGLALLTPSSQALAETADVTWKTVVDNSYKPPGRRWSSSSATTSPR